MESKLTTTLSRLLNRIDTLIDMRDNAIKERDDAMARCADLERQLKETQSRLDSVRLDAQYLSVSHKLAASPQALADARVAIRHLIAKVDKAIALINEDPEF